MENDPLAELRDLHYPDAIGWWPLAPGWWLLILLVITALSVLLRKAYLNKQKNRYRQTAQQELTQLQDQYQQHQDVHQYLADTQKLLRRVALHRYPDQQRTFAKLSGEQWQDFLNGCCQETIFSQRHHEVFTALPYQQGQQYAHESWHQAVDQWLEKHR